MAKVSQPNLFEALDSDPPTAYVSVNWKRPTFEQKVRKAQNLPGQYVSATVIPGQQPPKPEFDPEAPVYDAAVWKDIAMLEAKMKKEARLAQRAVNATEACACHEASCCKNGYCLAKDSGNAVANCPTVEKPGWVDSISQTVGLGRFYPVRVPCDGLTKCGGRFNNSSLAVRFRPRLNPPIAKSSRVAGAFF
jgi:hypothetical protein